MAPRHDTTAVRRTRLTVEAFAEQFAGAYVAAHHGTDRAAKQDLVQFARDLLRWLPTGVEKEFPFRSGLFFERIDDQTFFFRREPVPAAARGGERSAPVFVPPTQADDPS